jgi:hypothetical protein
MKYPICVQCDKESKYDQPDSTTGEIVSVCAKHFTMDVVS